MLMSMLARESLIVGDDFVDLFGLILDFDAVNHRSQNLRCIPFDGATSDVALSLSPAVCP